MLPLGKLQTTFAFALAFVSLPAKASENKQINIRYGDQKRTQKRSRPRDFGQGRRKDCSEAVQSLRDLPPKANIPGFRPGMVPMGIIKKMYGKGVVAEQSYRTASNAVFEYLQRRTSTIWAT